MVAPLAGDPAPMNESRQIDRLPVSRRPSARSAPSARLVRLCSPIAAALLVAVSGPADASGFQRVLIPDPADRPIDAGIWYPTERTPPAEANTPWGDALAIDAPVAGTTLPLVVISHGSEGWMGGHAGLARALADAGHVVVAPEHTGDRGSERGDDDAYPPSRWLVERPHHLSRAIDFVTGDWSGAASVDPSRVAVFGFSAGAYSALTLAGAVPDPERFVAHCEAEPGEWVCELGLGDDVAAALADGSLDPVRFGHLADPRVGAAVVAAPALGFAFDPDSLATLELPLQIWSGELDDAVPFASNTRALLAHLPSARVDHRPVAQAGHFAFRVPCGPALETRRPDLWQRVCVDAAGFDRGTFLERFRAEVVAFLGTAGTAGPEGAEGTAGLDETDETGVIAGSEPRSASRAGSIGVRSFEARAPHRDAPLGATLWYPAEAGGTPELVGDNGVFVGGRAWRDAPVAAGPHPLVLLSHGGGGNARQYGWIANRLVAAGFVVAAPDHPGSTTGNASAREAVAVWNRPADLSAVLTSLLSDETLAPLVDATRIGVLGFSAGGYTALAIGGARVDPDALARFCDDDAGDMSDCAFLARGGVDLHAMDLTPAAQDHRDARARSVVAVDPGIVTTLTTESLAAIDVPVTLVNLGAPGEIPKAVLAREASRTIPAARYVTVADAVHFSFLPECKPAGAAILEEEGEPDALCDDAGGRSRGELHERFADIVIDAFERDLLAK